jgi:hypothetical protein
MKISNMIGFFASVLVGSQVMAQTAPATLNTAPASVSFTTTTSYFDYSGSAKSVIAVTPTVSVSNLLVKDLTVSLSAPVFSQDSVSLEGLDVAAEYALWKGSVFGAKTNFSVNGGALIPVLDTAFAPDSVVPHVGAEVSLNWGKVSFTQDANFGVHLDGKVFNPILGGFVEDHVISATSTVAWQACDWFALKGNFVQQYVDGNTTLLAGPSASITPTKNVSIDFGVNLPVSQDVDSAFSEVDYVAFGGLTVSF